MGAMSDTPSFMAFAALTLANVPLFLGLAWAGFGSWADLLDSARSSLDPDMRRYLSADRWRILAGELSLGSYLVVCVLLTLVEYRMLTRFLGN